MDEIVSNGMGVVKLVMMILLAPLENCSQLIKGVNTKKTRLLLLLLSRSPEHFS